MTEQPEWTDKYANALPSIDDWRRPDASIMWQIDELYAFALAVVAENQILNDRIARLEAGQRELEARLGDGE